MKSGRGLLRITIVSLTLFPALVLLTTWRSQSEVTAQQNCTTPPPYAPGNLRLNGSPELRCPLSSIKIPTFPKLKWTR